MHLYELFGILKTTAQKTSSPLSFPREIEYFARINRRCINEHISRSERSGSIELLFRSVRNSPRPDKITTDYLASIGFRRQSDVKLLELLFFLGFIDSNLSPSELWNAASDSDEIAFASILAGALSKSYSKVFEIYPDGRNIDGKALMTLFKEQTGVSDTEAAYMVLTLQVLADMADFGKGETLQQKSPRRPGA